MVSAMAAATGCSAAYAAAHQIMGDARLPIHCSAAYAAAHRADFGGFYLIFKELGVVLLVSPSSHR